MAKKEGVPYSVVLITQHLDDKWRAHSYPLSGIREPANVAPNSLGFYYFPSKDTPEEALRRLKDQMIKERQLTIAKLTKEIQDIEEVKLRTRKCKKEKKEISELGPLSKAIHEFAEDKRKQHPGSKNDTQK